MNTSLSWTVCRPWVGSCYDLLLVDLGVTYTVHLWLIGKRVVDLLLVLIEFFCQLSWLRCYERILVEIVPFGRGWVTLSTNFRGRGCWLQKTRVTGLSRDVVCVILRLAILIQYRHVTHRGTDTHTHTQTHDDG